VSRQLCEELRQDVRRLDLGGYRCVDHAVRSIAAHALHRHHELADPVDTENLQQRTKHQGSQYGDLADVLVAQAAE
jgi:hypothetical protein